MEFTNSELLLSGTVIFVAYLVRGITGFGSALIAVPLLSLMMPLTTVVPLVVLLDLIGSGTQAKVGYRNVDWKVLRPLIPMTLIGIGLAIYFVKHIDTSTLAFSLGVFVICFALYQLLPTPTFKAHPLLALPFGVLGGFAGASFGTGGPFYAIYLGSQGLEKNRFRASYAVYFVLEGAVRVGVYIVGLSLIKIEWLGLLVFATIPWGLGLWAGSRVHREIDPMIFKRLISLVLLLSGSALILNN